MPGHAVLVGPTVDLGQNYPNPFNPATTIPFALDGQLFANGHRPKVSLRIYNVLAQLVAIPILQGSGDKLDNIELTCTGSTCAFTAYWDGKVLNSDREAASGVYLYQLVVDGALRDLGDKRYLLSPQDLAAVEQIPELLERGVTSFKIEGRLKAPEYVAAVCQVYRRALDANS